MILLICQRLHCRLWTARGAPASLGTFWYVVAWLGIKTNGNAAVGLRDARRRVIIGPGEEGKDAPRLAGPAGVPMAGPTLPPIGAYFLY